MFAMAAPGQQEHDCLGATKTFTVFRGRGSTLAPGAGNNSSQNIISASRIAELLRLLMWFLLNVAYLSSKINLALLPSWTHFQMSFMDLLQHFCASHFCIT